MARVFSKFDIPDDIPCEVEEPEEEKTEEKVEPKAGVTLRESHSAFRASDLIETSHKKPELVTKMPENEGDEEEKMVRSMVTMFKTLRMMMKMMKGLDGIE